LCEEIGEKATTRFLEAILQCAKANKEYAVLFLFDCLFYINEERHLPIIYEILENEEFKWIDCFILNLADAMITEPLDRIKTIRDNYVKAHAAPSFINEINTAINILETRKHSYPDETVPLFKKRLNWKEDMRNFILKYPFQILKT